MGDFGLGNLSLSTDPSLQANPDLQTFTEETDDNETGNSPVSNPWYENLAEQTKSFAAATSDILKAGRQIQQSVSSPGGEAAQPHGGSGTQPIGTVFKSKSVTIVVSIIAILAVWFFFFSKKGR